jgi:hypothetical protein
MAVIRIVAAAYIAVLSSACFAAEKPLESGPAAPTPSAFFVGVNGGVTWAQERLSHYSEVVGACSQTLAPIPPSAVCTSATSAGSARSCPASTAMLST